MTALGIAIAFVIFVALAVIGPKFGADSRPGPQVPPEAFFRHTS